ncbi:MAG: hypothetical protein PHX80_03995 [Candidatus Nanoarchaeia archaeon]|nr:hypothetical protein [Candidatus Nanoarchaeia archaeon]
MKRMYHPFTEWEDCKAGMYDKVSAIEKNRLLQEAIKFTGNYVEYGAWMVRVAKEWTKACEHNLTDEAQNRRAWIGHAACCMALKCPEYITREAWGFLTDQQREDANAMADKAIELWERGIYKNHEQSLF